MLTCLHGNKLLPVPQYHRTNVSTSFSAEQKYSAVKPSHLVQGHVLIRCLVPGPMYCFPRADSSAWPASSYAQDRIRQAVNRCLFALPLGFLHACPCTPVMLCHQHMPLAQQHLASQLSTNAARSDALFKTRASSAGGAASGTGTRCMAGKGAGSHSSQQTAPGQLLCSCVWRAVCRPSSPWYASSMVLMSGLCVSM